jgi:hypothetical protein
MLDGFDPRCLWPYATRYTARSGERSMKRTHMILLATAILLQACAQPAQQPASQPYAQSAGPLLHAEPWAEADRLFFNNPDTPEWKGADVANSVAVDDNRILWVFGDTLLAEPGVNACDRFGTFDIALHNSLALQWGTDPTTARIEHFWGHAGSGPESFFSPTEDDGSWYWMGGVTVFGDQALVFLMHARSTLPAGADANEATACAGLNFEMLGWDARIARITPQTPDKWQWRSVSLPDDVTWHGILAGSSTVTVRDDFLYAWSAGPATLAGNPVFLARWPLAAARRATCARRSGIRMRDGRHNSRWAARHRRLSSTTATTRYRLPRRSGRAQRNRGGGCRAAT